MKYLENDIAYFHYNEAVLDSITRFCFLIRDNPFFLKPFRGINEEMRNIFPVRDKVVQQPLYFFDRTPVFCRDGLFLLPTVKKTLLFYDEKNDCFLKIIHPLTFKNKVFSLFSNKAKSIYYLSENLLSKGIKVPKILTFGVIKKIGSPFFIMGRVDGRSLLSILIKEKKKFPFDIYLKIIDRVAEVHRIGYWFGDLRISHIFMKNGDISGFIDIDNMRKNIPFRLRNLAKDIAGLNHPELPLSDEEKMSLFKHYISKLDIKKGEHLLQLVKHYTNRRWNR
ncbi:MAG: lipopolysaccharide kinase InaA family protein [Nitrospirota bacterium]